MSIKGTFVKSEHFEIIDTIGVPHPYCITPKHVVWASDHHCGRLGDEAIREAEERGGAKCGVRDCYLSYAEHEQALVVGCKAELKIDGEVNPELHQFLLDNKEEAERNHYAGFAFKDVS